MRNALRIGAVILLLGRSGASAQTVNDFQEVARIGIDDGPPEQVLGSVAAVRFGADDSILILDAMNCELREFQIGGTFVRKYGRCGEGPGEFRFPTHLIVANDQTIVIDGVLKRQARFGRDGSHIETRSITPVGRFDVLIPMRHGFWFATNSGILTDGPLVALTSRSRAAIAREGPALRAARGYPIAFFRDPERVDTLAVQDHGMTLTVQPGGGVGLLNRRWGPGGSWAVSGDSMIVLVNNFDGQVRVLRVEENGLRPIRAGRIPLTPQPLGESDWSELAALHRRERPLSQNVSLIGPPYRAQLDEVVFDDRGAAWIRRINYDPLHPDRRAVETEYVVIPTDGGAQSVVRLPGTITLHAVRGDLLLATTKTEAGSPVVVVLRRGQS